MNDVYAATEFLKHSSFDVNFKVAQDSLLYYTTILNRPAIAQLLIEKKAEIIRPNNSIPLLHLAVKHESLEMLTVFLRNGVYVDCLDEGRNTALAVACSNLFVKGVQLLLRSGAKSNIKNTEGQLPFHSVVTVTNYEQENLRNQILQLLLQNRGVSPNTKMGNATLFQLACQKRGTETLNLLFNQKVTIDLRDEYGLTVLHYAATNEFSDGPLRLILKKNLIDVNDNNNCFCSTPINTMCNYQHVSCFMFYELLKHGADIRIHDAKGRFPSLPCPKKKHDCETMTYLKKLESLRYPINAEIKANFSSFHNEKFMENLNLEKNDLQTKLLDPSSGVHLFNFLLMNRQKAAIYVNNKKLVNLRKEDFTQRFPNYGEILNLKFDQGLKRRKLEKKAKSSFFKLIGVSPNKKKCCDKIIILLNNRQLQKLIHSCKCF